MLKELEVKVLRLLVIEKGLRRRYNELQTIYITPKVGLNLEELIVFKTLRVLDDESLDFKVISENKLRRIIFDILRDLRRSIIF